MGRRKKVDTKDTEESVQSYVIDTYLKEHPGWILFDKEYDVIPFTKGLGKGDLVFCLKDKQWFNVVECKCHSPGQTFEQAEYYASWIKLRFPNARVSYQTCVLKEFSILYEMDLNKAIYNTLSKIHQLTGLNKNELSTLTQLYQNLYLG